MENPFSHIELHNILSTIRGLSGSAGCSTLRGMAHHKFTPGANQYAVIAGRRVAAVRKAKKWTLANLSDATNGDLTPSRISNYELGTRELGIREAILLANALKAPAAYLMGLCDDIDRELLQLPAETKLALLAVFKTRP